MKPKTYITTEHINLIPEMNKKGYSDAKIGRLLGYGRNVIFYHRRKLGLPSNKQKVFTQEQIDQVVDLRLKRNKYLDISIITGIPRSFILKICNEHIDKDVVQKIGKENQLNVLIKYNYDRLPELHSQGLSDVEIGKILNTTRQNIRKERIKLGLPSNVKKLHFSKEDDDTITTMLNNNEKIEKIAETLKRPSKSIYARLYKLGINIKEIRKKYKETQNEDDSEDTQKSTIKKRI